MPAVKLRDWLDRDYFPDTERLLRRTVYNRLGALLLGAVIALLCGLFLGPNGLILFWGLLAVIALGVIWPWIGLRGLAGTISFDQARSRENERVRARLAVRNRLPWAAWGLHVRGGFDTVCPRELKEVPSPETSLAVVPGRDNVSHSWELAPRLRGEYPHTPPRLATGFPFGLRESWRLLDVERCLLVWPRTFPVGPVPNDEGTARHEGTVSRSKVGSDGESIGVRPYRQGDSPRRIHWGQSAKSDRLIVCELQSAARPSVQLILDTSLNSYVGDTREWAIRVFASFVEGWLADGVPVAAIIGLQQFPAASGRSQRDRVMDALAKLGADGAPLSEVLSQPHCRAFDGVQVVVTSNVGRASITTPIPGRRFVVLHNQHFSRTEEQMDATTGHDWLSILGPDDVAPKLRRGWMEAVHG